MKQGFFIIIAFICCKIISAQNLVPNGDFEQYISCPTDQGQLQTAAYWINPGVNSPDYYNSCATNSNCSVPYNWQGFQIPHSGQGYGGIYLWQNNATNIREFMETPLTSPLAANTCYFFEMYVNLHNLCDFTTDDIQIYFVDSLVMGSSFFWPVPVTPQVVNNSGIVFDTLNWTSVYGYYTAVGGENHIIIGNLFHDVNTTIVSLGSPVHPYVYVYIDDVSLTPCTALPEHGTNQEIRIYPNPFNDKLNVSSNSDRHSEIILYDLNSRIILRETFEYFNSLNTENLAKGLYFYEVRMNNGSSKNGKVVKN